MSKIGPKISILIPTFNRAPYLRYTLATCVAQDYDNLEIIVHDDASDDMTEAVVADFLAADSRVRYIRAQHNRGMRLNFEQGLTEVRGDYLICLGGDDALIPNQLAKLVDIINEFPNNVVTWPTASYLYPGARSGCGQLVAPHILFGRAYIQLLESSEYFSRQITNLWYVSDQKAPMLYVKSCIPMVIIKKIKDLSGGVFFKSSTPDGYSSFAISSVERSYLFTNRSFSMHGVSPNSAGLNYVGGNGGKEDLSQKFFKDNQSVTMAPQLGSIPYSPLISMMTADFIYQTDLIFSHGFSKSLSAEAIIKRALREMADGLYSEQKISREKTLLRKYADFAGKSEYYRDQISKIRRNSKVTLNGDAMSGAAIYLSADRVGVQNVLEAAHFIASYQNDKRIYAKMNIPNTLLNSLKYKFQSIIKNKSLSDV